MPSLLGRQTRRARRRKRLDSETEGRQDRPSDPRVLLLWIDGLAVTRAGCYMDQDRPPTREEGGAVRRSAASLSGNICVSELALRVACIQYACKRSHEQAVQ